MEQILELHPHEDVYSIRDRLASAESERVLLVIPPYSQVLKRRVDLNVIQRFAQEHGLELGLVTGDADQRAVAAELGIPTFRSVAAGQRRQRWRRRDDDGFGPYRPPDRSQAHRAAQDRDARLAPSPLRHRLWTIAKVALIGAVVVALGAALVAVVPSADIHLVPTSDRVVANVTVIADPEVAAADIAAARVPAREVASDEVKGKITIPVTGKKGIPTSRATGVVFFVNQLNIPFRVQKGTVVRTTAGAQPIRFVVTAEVDVPPGIGAQAQAPIEAVEVGALGNVPANFINEIEGAAALALRVSNPDETRGGGDREVTAVDPIDLDNARALLLEQLKEQAALTLTETQLEPSEFVLPSSVRADAILDQTYDREVTEQATELTLQMRVSFSGLAVDSADANAIVFAALQNQAPAGYALLPTGLAFQRGNEQPVGDTGQHQFEMQGIGYAAANLDVGRALRAIAGRPRDAAISILQRNLSLQQPPRITVSPSWFPVMPLLPVRMQVVVDTSG